MAIDWQKIFDKKPELAPPGYWEAVQAADKRKQERLEQERILREQKQAKKKKQGRTNKK